MRKDNLTNPKMALEAKTIIDKLEKIRFSMISYLHFSDFRVFFIPE